MAVGVNAVADADATEFVPTDELQMDFWFFHRLSGRTWTMSYSIELPFVIQLTHSNTKSEQLDTSGIVVNIMNTIPNFHKKYNS